MGGVDRRTDGQLLGNPVLRTDTLGTCNEGKLSVAGKTGKIDCVKTAGEGLHLGGPAPQEGTGRRIEGNFDKCKKGRGELPQRTQGRGELRIRGVSRKVYSQESVEERSDKGKCETTTKAKPVSLGKKFQETRDS